MSDPMFNIVQFQAASGLPLTATFIVETLGVGPDHTEKRAMFWKASKYGLIIGRLQNFINGKAASNPCDLSGERPKTKKTDDAAPPPAAAAAASTEADDLFSEGDDDLFGDEPASTKTETAEDLF